MIRAANTGVSAVIDAYGRTLVSLGMNEEGILDHRIPGAREATPYSRWGDGMLLAVIAFLGVGLWAGGLRGKRPSA
jgi:apolipoprotein N-acyltransferase